jgi:hypothetical protein
MKKDRLIIMKIYKKNSIYMQDISLTEKKENIL